MAIKVGDRLPKATFVEMTSDGPTPVESGAFFKGKTVALFAVPGAFTPVCSDHHLPGYLEKADALKAKGVDVIACTAVNDPFVMGAWGKNRNVDGKVRMLADGNGDFAKAIGLTFDGSGLGLGTRSQRYAMLVKDGVVAKLEVEASPVDHKVSSAEHLLELL